MLFFEFGLKDIIDIVLVAVMLFYAYRLMKESRSLNVFIGILVFIVLWLIVSQVLQMKLLGSIMDKVLSVGVIGLVILFQDDIRKFLFNLGERQRMRALRRFFTNGDKKLDKVHLKQAIMPVVLACMSMSKKRVGALIVIQRATPLDDIVSTGEIINADINQRLAILTVALVVDVLDAHAQSEIPAVVDVAADVEVILTDVALLAARHAVAFGIVVVEVAVVGIRQQDVVIEVVELAVGVAVANPYATVVFQSEAVLSPLDIRELVLRSSVETVGSRKDVVEVATLVVVEAEVQERLRSRLLRIDKAYLVEAHTRLLAPVEVAGILLTHEASCGIDGRVPEESDTCRVGRYGRDVCP